MNKNITIIGNVTGATGGAVVLTLLQGSTIIKSSQYYGPFPATMILPLAIGTAYRLIVGGFTQGTFTIDVRNCATISQPVPKSYPANQNFNDVFDFTV